ncbi:virulence RhuM family protein [Sulfurospirillum sp. 'SP']|nr:virulence RhuM family protein [Sulfurospirillum sp. 'SP']WNY99957.1 virulence RhuM family protein [Sulfurospirillum sp. 'SP']
MSEIILYKTPNQDIRVEMLIENETIWLPQQRIAELFDTTKQNISLHVKNIFESGELDENSVVKDFLTTATDGKNYKTKHYNLDAIISIGYRVNSTSATQFRIWATNVLKEYIIKGFAMDDERLKSPAQPFGKDYFEEQLERIRDIRASERRFYQKITDIYAKCSSDYDVNSEITKEFYATVQNKLHYAITGLTAAEIIKERCNASLPHMGLTSWKNSPNGAIRKTDVTVAKNYLSSDELDMYNRIVEMYLNFAEFQAKSKKMMTQKDWIEKLHSFLTMNERDILQDKGKITAKFAEQLAFETYEKFKNEQDKIYVSDFDKLVAKVETKS